MWPFNLCGGTPISCFSWIANLPLLHKVGIAVGIFVVLFVLLRIINAIFSFFGFDEIGH